MWIVAIAWIYVVGLMAVAQTSVVAGIMTFFAYCVLPLSILFYLTGRKRRAARRARNAARTDATESAPDFSASHDSKRNDHDSDGARDDSGAGDSGGAGSDGGGGAD